MLLLAKRSTSHRLQVCNRPGDVTEDTDNGRHQKKTQVSRPLDLRSEASLSLVARSGHSCIDASSPGPQGTGSKQVIHRVE